MVRRRTRKKVWSRLLFIVVITGLLVYGGMQVFPYCYAILKGQPYINPRVKTRADETYQLEFWVKMPSLAASSPAREKLEQSIAQFQTTHPNFEINITYLPEEQAMERLLLALEEGSPPDLFFHADSSQTYFGELQIPLEIYVGSQEKHAWPEAVWQQAAVNNRVYSLPVALFPRVLLVNTDLWQPTTCQRSDVIDSGWTWEQFIQCIAEAKTDQVYGFVPTSIGDALLASLLAVGGEPKLLNNDGSPAWSKEQLLELAAAWQQLSESPAVPSPPKSMDRDCLSLFLNKKAASIGPLNHYLAKWLWERSVQAGITPSLWPMPNQKGYSDLRGVYLTAFRQSTYQGHRHSKATAELAYYLAGELALLMHEFTGAVPAQSHLLNNLSLPYTQESLAVYTDLEKALPTSYTYGPEPGMANKHWQHTIAPAWNTFVNGEYSAEEFAEAILTGLVRATMKGP